MGQICAEGLGVKGHYTQSTMAKEKIEKIVNIKNKRASFEYQFLDTYVTGIMLTGTEIKSIRQQKVSLQDAYCYFDRNELFIKNMNIAKYSEGTYYNHDPLRERKLLMKKSELRKLENKLDDGLTIVPLRLFINDRGLAKMEIALAKGKKLYDKREDIKARDVAREMQRER
jgi:SsrA-binding protein